MISIYEIFKVGIGPSSSHTMGPMIAAHQFRGELPLVADRLTVELFGSLAWTGQGHATDVAICLGLLGQTPADVDLDAIPRLLAGLHCSKQVVTEQGRQVRFDAETDLVWDRKTRVSDHPNTMRFRAYAAGSSAPVLERVFLSIGGGFVQRLGEVRPVCKIDVPYPFGSGAELLWLCQRHNKSIAEIQLLNEQALRSRAEIEAHLDHLWSVMSGCIERGLQNEGDLPGNLRVKRRAKHLVEKLRSSRTGNALPPHEMLDWVSAYAIAVNEENAAGGRVVTAPTNGAAGIIPAVLRYCRELRTDCPSQDHRSFLLSAGAIGALIKSNASISGAEVGCQGEVGSAASMAAAGLAAVLGGTPEQVENAAEIAMEHHLGLTCDPIGGLVQIPCIERNAFGAHKAIAAASLALRGDGSHRVSLDEVIETMRQTGVDMKSKYKETSLGGLAVNVSDC